MWSLIVQVGQLLVHRDDAGLVGNVVKMTNEFERKLTFVSQVLRWIIAWTDWAVCTHNHTCTHARTHHTHTHTHTTCTHHTRFFSNSLHIYCPNIYVCRYSPVMSPSVVNYLRWPLHHLFSFVWILSNQYCRQTQQSRLYTSFTCGRQGLCSTHPVESGLCFRSGYWLPYR